MLVAHDALDAETLTKLLRTKEIMINMDWIVILGERALKTDMSRQEKQRKLAKRSSYRETPGAVDRRGSESSAQRPSLKPGLRPQKQHPSFARKSPQPERCQTSRFHPTHATNKCTKT